MTARREAETSLGEFESFKLTNGATPGGFITPEELRRPGTASPTGAPQGDTGLGNTPLKFGPGFRPYASRPGNVGPIGVNTTSPYPDGYIPGVSDLPPGATPHDGWDGSALAPPPRPVQPQAGLGQPAAPGPGNPPPTADVRPPAEPAKSGWDANGLLSSEFLDRAAAGVSTAYMGARWSKFASQTAWPGVKDIRSMTSAEWQKALWTEPLGKTMAISYGIDTFLDGFTGLKTYSTSPLTFAVDIGTPWIAKYALGKYGMLASIGISVAAHIGEKLFFEKPNQQ